MTVVTPSATPPATAPTTPPATGFARDTAVLASGLVLSQLLMLAVMPLWTRQYGPEAFAALGLWMSVVAVVSVLLLLRYDTCIVVARDDAEARALLRLCQRLALVGGTLLALLAWALPAPWLAAIGLQPLGPWLPAAVAGGALASMFAARLAWANRQRAYLATTRARVGLAAATVALGSLLGLSGVSAGLLWAQLAAGGLALWLLRAPSAALAPGALAAAARQHQAAPRYLWPSALLDACTQQLPMWLAVLWFSAVEAGHFSLAWRVTAIPVLMLAAAAGAVFYQRFAALASQPHQARRLLLRTWAGLALLGLLPVLVLALWGAPLFAGLFGPQWAAAGTLAAVLAPMLWAMLVSSPTSGALIALGLQKWAPLFGVAMLLYRPAALWAGAQQGSLALGLALWAACEVVAIVLYNLLLLRELRTLRALHTQRQPDAA